MTKTSAPATEWILEGAIPAGCTIAIADLDDPPTSELFRRGFDCVMRLNCRGEANYRPVLLEILWRDGLVPGHEPPPAFWVRPGPDGIERVEGPS